MSAFSLIAVLLTSVFPLSLVWLVGIIIAAITWKRHPGVSLLVIIVFVLFMLHAIISEILIVNAPSIIRGSNMSIAAFFGIINLFNTVINIALWSLLILAIFGWRKLATSATTYTSPALREGQQFQEQPPLPGEPQNYS